MQRQTFSASPWEEAAGRVVCGGGGGGRTEECTVSVRMTPPSVMAVWVRQGLRLQTL